MAQAGARRVRANTPGNRARDPRFNVAGYARMLSHPAYERLVRAERPLRRLIPVLIVIFLAIVAAARWMSLSNGAAQLRDAANAEMDFIAELLGDRIQTLTATRQDESNPDALQNLIADTVPSKYLANGREVLVTDRDGRILANLPFERARQGLPLEHVIDDVFLLTTFGKRADIREVRLREGETAIAAHRILDGRVAGVTIFQREEQIFAGWRNDVSLNVTLFVGTSSILLIVLYAYFAQSTRAQEADEICNIVQSRFDTALTRGRGGLWDWDLARGQIYWSRSMHTMLGRKPREDKLGFAEVAELVREKDLDLFQLANSVIVDNFAYVDTAFRMRHCDGDWVWLRLRAEVVRDAAGDAHLIGVASDITEEQALKQQSRRSNMRLHDAIENLSEAFVLWDADKRLVMCNSKYQELHGLTQDVTKPGARYEEVMAAARTPAANSRLISGSKGEENARTLEAQLEDGRWLQINERRTEDGGFVSVGTDITTIKLHERKLIDSERRLMATIADLKKSRLTLEQQAVQLSELNDKLERERNRAEAANRAKSEFLANMSHELRTPLNAVIGFSEIMRTGMFGPLGSEKYTEYCRDIHESGRFLLGVINDILDMSKIEAGRFTLEFETMRLNKILDETLRIVKFQAHDRGIEIVAKMPQVIQIEADRRALKQILINLLSNAVKFSHDDGRVFVRARAVGDCVTISIEDHGIGISRAGLIKLGRPFEQVQNQFTKNHKGSGLGLAIARSLALMHGGAMKIRSKEAKGTIVSVRLPLRQKAPSPQRENRAREAKVA
jgi:two-component system cell cycle sensor histidine kinase PleC